jgi:hypothetical protein
MSGIELTALIIAGVWLGALTLAVLALVRQLGLLLAFTRHRGQAMSTGSTIELGSAIPSIAYELGTVSREAWTYLVFTDGHCAACQAFLADLDRELVPQGTTIVVGGTGDAAAALTRAAPAGIRVLEEPAATRLREAFAVTVTPVALKLGDGVVLGRALVRHGADLSALANAADSSGGHHHENGWNEETPIMKGVVG